MEPDADERLRQLLRWKRWEQPDAAFWERFDATFQKKRLQPPPRERWIDRLVRPLRGTFLPSCAAAGLLCAAVLISLPPRPAGVLAEPREMEFLLLTQEGSVEAVEEEIFDEGDDGVCYVSPAIPWSATTVLSAYHF